MITAQQVKFKLDQQLLDFASGGPLPVITSVHSVIEEDGVVSVGFDLERFCPRHGRETALIFFEFNLPVAFVDRADLREFAQWLASPLQGTAH